MHSFYVVFKKSYMSEIFNSNQCNSKFIFLKRTKPNALKKSCFMTICSFSSH